MGRRRRRRAWWTGIGGWEVLCETKEGEKGCRRKNMIVYMHKEVCRRAALMHAALRFVSFENLPHITRSTTILFVFFMCMF
jgi:hypothetical protein